ncbi:MAG TPA: hypothetical protein VFU29_18470 [Chitinophagaceae bacterium]|nr:hypothetical protein [Chitinophagaceae bacterium]
MRVIKLAILSFIFLFLLVTIISLFIPGHIRISKATNIIADDTVVFTHIKALPEWKQWHPALKAIPENEFQVLNDSNISIRGTTISIAESKMDELVTEMKTGNGRPIISGFKIIRHQQGDSATLQWYMDFKLKWYPWEKFRSLFYENIYGVQMEQGLLNLKELSEGRRSSSN